MDNITHTIVGLGVGELLERSLLPEADTLRARTRRRVASLDPAIVEMSEVTASLRVLRQLQRDDCHVNAWLRFARAPALSMATGEASDYRFASTRR